MPTHPPIHPHRPPACLARRSIEFRLRPPGVELWTTHKATASEAALMFMLLGAREPDCLLRGLSLALLPCQGPSPLLAASCVQRWMLRWRWQPQQLW
jgi:hypothetical protein